MTLMKHCVQPALEDCLYNPDFNINFLARSLPVDEEIVLVDRMVPVVNDIMDRICRMSKVHKTEAFENPIVLSFMATAFVDGSFAPDKWYFLIR